MYLTDADLLKFLVDCKENLTVSEDKKKSGMIFVKENVSDKGFYLDKTDNSLVRSDQHFMTLFEEAGF